MLPIYQIFPNFLQQCSVKTQQGSGSDKLIWIQIRNMRYCKALTKRFSQKSSANKNIFSVYQNNNFNMSAASSRIFLIYFPNNCLSCDCPFKQTYSSVHEGVNYVISIYVTHPQDAMLVLAYSYICK